MQQRQQQGKRKIKVKDAAGLVGSRREYRVAMVRNRWYVPALSSSLLSIRYMDAVRKRQLFAFKYE